MPVVLAVNGTVEVYYPRRQSPRIAPVSDGSDGTRQPAKDYAQQPPPRTVISAQQAYKQQTQMTGETKPALLATDLMSSPVTTLPPAAPIAEAWSLMQRKGFRHLPIVTAEGTLAGMLSDRDLIRFWEEADIPGTAGRRNQPVGSLMTRRVISATLATDVRELARVMLLERISAVPILDGQHHPLGIVTTSDILRAVVHRSPLELWT